MSRQQFVGQVRRLRGEGKSIRVIAAELGAHRSRVHRALKAIARNTPELKPLTQTLGSDFVGRKHEMAQLVAGLDDAAAGRGRLVMLAGEPGIGKTRTLQELAAVAEERGARVIWGVSYEEEGTPPFWPWVQALRSYVREVDAETLGSQMGPGAADIAELVPDVRVKLPHLEPPPAPDDPRQARFRLFDSIASFLKSASETQPLVVVLEDLHWSDKPSLVLLEFIAREVARARLMVVGTYRDVELSHALLQTLAELMRAPRFLQMVLKGLDTEEVAYLTQITTGTKPRRELVKAIADRTEGNPFFVTEVVRLLSEEGELTSEAPGRAQRWAGLIPQGVRLLVGRRLDNLSEDCNQVLTIASVTGREFELRELKSLVKDMSEERLLRALEESLSARVIEDVPGVADRYRFSHALIQETLADELSAARRVRLHARIGEALEELYGADAEDQAAQLAYHFAQAETVLGTEKLVRYSLLAGERSLAAYTFEEALSHFQRGLSAVDAKAMDSTKAALLVSLGRAQTAMFQWKEALASLTAAFDYYAQVGDVDRAVAVAEVPSSDNIQHRLTGASGLLGRALDLLPPDGLRAGRLLSTYGAFLGIDEARYGDAREALDRALAIAWKEDDPVLEMRTLGNQGFLDVFWLNIEEAWATLLHAIELAQELNDPRAETLFHFHVAMVSVGQGDMVESMQRMNDCVAAAQKVRDPRARALGLRAANICNAMEFVS